MTDIVVDRDAFKAAKMESGTEKPNIRTVSQFFAIITFDCVLDRLPYTIGL